MECITAAEDQGAGPKMRKFKEGRRERDRLIIEGSNPCRKIQTSIAVIMPRRVDA